MSEQYIPPPDETSLAESIEPMPGRIAVKVKDFEEVRAKSGLYLTEGAMRQVQGGEKPVQGVVIALAAPDATVVDDEEYDNDTALKVGDRVVFGKYSGVELARGRERIIILRTQDIICRITQPSVEVKVKS